MVLAILGTVCAGGQVVAASAGSILIDDRYEILLGVKDCYFCNRVSCFVHRKNQFRLTL